ncbi:MAG: CDP-diacylglycerol O-phosphatidyltransferase [Deltaproteobacteria bacterium]|nr:CDP-diacylglycerol O-phosphatidyltransferase [Deltaproteobacteria bacterium]
MLRVRVSLNETSNTSENAAQADPSAQSDGRDRAIAWLVHGFTASGAALGTFALVAVASDRLDVACLLMLATLFIDGLDGTLARAARVSVHTPQIDGRRLDDIVDYLNFVIVPAFFLWGGGLVLHPGWIAMPVLASAYGFSREDAKTADDFFLGFPSYWNILAMYLWLLGVGPEAGTIWVVVLAIGVFIPMKYLYPSKVQPMRLRVALGVGAIVWTAALVACVVAPDEAAGYHLVEITLLYPAWYMWLSITRGGFDRTNG